MKWGRHNRFDLETAKARFLEKTKPVGDCIVWTGAIGSHGRYGIITLAGRQWLAHRAAWFLFRCEDPGDNVVCHRCDNGFCVNLDHLFLGSQHDNILDMETKMRSRHPAGEKHGRAKLTAEQVTEIRRLHSEGISIRELGRRYPVNRSTVARIVNGKGWLP